jgi:hypothetical protein
MITKRNRDEFMILMARAMPDASAYTVAQAAGKLMAASSAHKRACEGDCSLVPPGDNMNHWTDRAAKAEVAARKAAPLGWTIRTQTDPRGATMWLQSDADATRIFVPQTGYPARVFAR